MPRLSILLLISFLFLASCKKDLIHPRHVTRLESHTVNRLNKIIFVNDTLGFVAGGSRFNEADVLITKDGGHTWQLHISQLAGKELFNATLSPTGAVYFIGFDGQLLWTSDAGNTWAYRQTRYEAYQALAFQAPDKLLAVGGISFLRGDYMTMDSSGNVSSHDSLGYELNDLVLLPGGRGYRCGYGAMQYTTNAGQSWQWAELRNDNYKAIDIRDDLTAYTCGGEGSICITRNGGKDWATLRNGNDLTHPKYRLQDILFLNSTHGYAVGEKGVMIFTDDAGRHWSELERFTDENLHGIAVCPNGDLIVCGEGGALWRIQP